MRLEYQHRKRMLRLSHYHNTFKHPGDLFTMLSRVKSFFIRRRSLLAVESPRRISTKLRLTAHIAVFSLFSPPRTVVVNSENTNKQKW